jgi:hypothetical protein
VAFLAGTDQFTGNALLLQMFPKHPGALCGFVLEDGDWFHTSIGWVLQPVVAMAEI